MGFGKYSKGGVKMHTVLDLRGSIPDSIYITDSRWHDSNFLDVYEPYKWAIYTMDKAYVDYEALYRMHLNGTYFVTRAKATMKYDVIDINYNANDLVGIVGDKTIHLSVYVSEKKYPEDLRLIEFYDAEKDEVITFITNNFELGSLIIANIYRNRWQIETFFKWIKGNLTIKALWGYSENAVKIHLWVAISTYLLLAWVKAELKSPLTITEISKVIGASLLTKRDIRELLNVPEPLTQNLIRQDIYSTIEFMTRILIICTGNRCRSQMAQGILQHLDQHLDVHSAGTEPASEVHPLGVNVMAENGIDISKHNPKHNDKNLGESWD